MKIDEVKVGDEVVFHNRWAYGTDAPRWHRLRVEEIVRVESTVAYGRNTSIRSVRKVRTQLLDWETGEEIEGGGTYLAKDLRRFDEVKAEMDGREALEARRRALKERTEAALDRLGVAGRVLAHEYGRGVAIHLDEEGVDALVKAALL